MTDKELDKEVNLMIVNQALLAKRIATDTRLSFSEAEGLMQAEKGRAKAALSKLMKQERIEENQMYLDRINNFKPKPGQLTAANFGSAGVGIETSGWQHAFLARIKELKGE